MFPYNYLIKNYNPIYYSNNVDVYEANHITHYGMTRTDNCLVDNYTGSNKFFCLYEEENTEAGKIYSSISPRFFDMSCLCVPTDNVFEILQIDETYDSRYTKYTRSIVFVKDYEKFVEDIRSIKSANPDIVILKQIEN